MLASGSAIVAVGLALYARIGPGAVDYWTVVLPPTVVVALGMALCVVSQTTSVIASVNQDQVARVHAATVIGAAFAALAALCAATLIRDDPKA